jgi:phenol 2-monooxygenase
MIYLDLHKIYIDDESYHSGHGHAYEVYGVNPKNGATAIVRPDGCKSKIASNPIGLLPYAN